MDPQPQHVPGKTPTRRLAIGSLLVATGSTLLLLTTSGGLPMSWDEGNAIGRADRIARWARRSVHTNGQAELPGLFSRQAITEHWQYTTQLEGHPAFYGIVIALGRWLSAGRLAPLDAARLGPILLFGLATGAMFYRMGREHSLAAAAGAAASLLLMPRVFAHAHFASCDGPLTSCWILSWATFAAARTGWGGVALWAVALGMTLSSKATGWIAPVPFVLWTILYRDRAGAKALAVGLPLAGAVFLLLDPPLWHDPVQGAVKFFELNMHRAAQPGLNVSTWFLGRMHNLDYPLPWYNTLFWTGITVPVGILLLSAVGLLSGFVGWPPQRAGTLLAVHWLALVVARALPGAPPHDGVRLFLPSFAFLAALAGLGCARFISWRTDRPKTRWANRTLTIATAVAIFAGSATSLLWYHPQWLSYYNLLIGGLPRATDRGMEPTYYWDGLDRSVLDWLHRNTAPDEKIYFAAGSTENLQWMERWGTLRRSWRPDAPGQYRWYVLQYRPSAWQPVDRWLIRHRQPAYRKTIRRGGWGPWRLDVPLVEIYPYAGYLEGRRVVSSQAAWQGVGGAGGGRFGPGNVPDRRSPLRARNG